MSPLSKVWRTVFSTLKRGKKVSGDIISLQMCQQGLYKWQWYIGLYISLEEKDKNTLHDKKFLGWTLEK